jgi:murein L,D-transpeptidase YafK
MFALPSRSHRCGFALTLALAGSFACAGPPGESAPEPPQAPAPPLEPRAPLACDRVERIDVWKDEREMLLACANGAQLRWTAAIGREPRGAKLQIGDLRTPEGSYRIAGPLEPSRFHGFIPIDYPSLADADRALAEGRLTAAERARIADAHARGALPPADTALGGDIGIHGEGARWQGDSEHLDWTYGCIAVTDEQLEFLAERVAPGVPIEIHP